MELKKITKELVSRMEELERVNKIITQTQLTDAAADMIEEVMVNPLEQTDEITIEPLS